MGQVKIYAAEEGLNLDGSLHLSYSTAINFNQDTQRFNKFVATAAKGSKVREQDLAYFEDILVSTGQNKNKDIFLPTEIFRAQASAKHKRVNLKHEDKLIIGHIIDSFAVDENYNELTVDEDNLPNHFHILSSCVIYKAWSDSEILEKVKEALKLIARGEMCVSVEAIFSDFDYGLSKGSQEYIVKRDEESAFLTKHLVRYGGTGEYKGYSLGQVLRNITFNGKALTTIPANPQSIILNETVAFNGPMVSLSQLNSPNNTTVTVLDNNVQETSMETKVADASNQVMVSQIEDLKATVASLKKERDDAHAKAVEVANAQTKAEIDGLKADVAKRDENVVSLNEQIKSLNAKLAEAADLKTKAEDSLVALTKEVETLKIGIVKSDRIASLVANGMSETDATTKVEKLISVSDEQFAEVLALVKANFEAKKTTETSSQVLGEATEKKEGLPAGENKAEAAEKAIVTLAQYLSKNHYTKANKFSVSK